MKKIFLIIALVLCVAIAALAIATSINNATPVVATLSTDSSIVMSLGEQTSASIVLSKESSTIYPIFCNISRSDKATGNGRLTIRLTDDGPRYINNVTVALFSDSECNYPLDGKSRVGAGDITVENISASSVYYANISIPNNVFDVTKVGGKMELSFFVEE